MNLSDDVRRDRERRLLNQRAFRRYFVDCSCGQGCATCAYTGLLSSAEAKQVAERNPTSPRSDGRRAPSHRI
jgi:hypothetical protein